MGLEMMWIPLSSAILKEYILEKGGIHGPAHWLRVRANGLALARLTPDADATVVEAFALLHDSRRFDDFRDLGHGERAADFARDLHARGILTLSATRLEILAEACAGHEHGEVSDHPTIGCCWDADRLDLSRLERPPIDEFLSTLAARDTVIQRNAWARGAGWHIDEEGARRWGIDPASLIP